MFTKETPGKPWLVSEDSGFLSPLNNPRSIEAPVSDTDGYVMARTSSQHVRATKVADKLARLWQQTKVDGAVPDQTTFEITEQLQARLARMAEHRDGGVQANGLRARFTFYVDPHDPLVEFADAHDRPCLPGHPGKGRLQRRIQCRPGPAGPGTAQLGPGAASRPLPQHRQPRRLADLLHHPA